MNRIMVYYYENEIGGKGLIIRNDIKGFTNEVVAEFEGNQAEMMWEIMRAVDYSKTPNCISYGLYVNDKPYKPEIQENPTCCFCGRSCENAYGNNPYPASKKDGERCCNVCNSTVVIPARIAEAVKGSN